MCLVQIIFSAFWMCEVRRTANDRYISFMLKEYHADSTVNISVEEYWDMHFVRLEFMYMYNFVRRTIFFLYFYFSLLYPCVCVCGSIAPFSRLYSKHINWHFVIDMWFLLIVINKSYYWVAIHFSHSNWYVYINREKIAILLHWCTLLGASIFSLFFLC